MNFIKTTLFVLIIFCSINIVHSQETKIKTETEWKKTLSPIQYYVLREKGTERQNSGEYNKHYEKGIYHCAGCNTVLFSSKNKYNSHSGWPSFDSYLKKNVKQIEDNTHGMKRIEIICATCDGHLGHVFNDGPRKTTGKRYCVNSVSLKFQKK